MDNRSAEPLVNRRVAVRVQNNFHPVLSTKLCEQSGNMVHNHVLGNLQLRGNLIVRQTDRDKAYQLFVSPGQLRCLLILHIAFVDRVTYTKNSSHVSVRGSPLAGIVRRIRASGQPIQTQFQVPHLAVSAASKPPYCITCMAL